MDKWDKQSWNQKIIPKKQKVVMSKSTKIIYGAFFYPRSLGNPPGKVAIFHGENGDQPMDLEVTNRPVFGSDNRPATIRKRSSPQWWVTCQQWTNGWGMFWRQKPGGKPQNMWWLDGLYMDTTWVSNGYHVGIIWIWWYIIMIVVVLYGYHRYYES